MLFFGVLARNLPFFGAIIAASNKELSSILRKLCLTNILVHAGLHLDPAALKKNSGATLRLTLLPQFFEGCTVAITSYFILNIPLTMAFCVGMLMAAVSPAVVVPTLMDLIGLGYATKGGVATLILAACSLDDVVAIALFSIFLSLTYGAVPKFEAAGSHEGHGGALGWLPEGVAGQLLHPLFELIIGIGGGLLIGYTLGYIFQTELGNKRKFKCIKASPTVLFIILMATCMGMMIIAVFANITGSAFLMAMTIPCVMV